MTDEAAPTFFVAAVVLRDDAGRILTVRKQGTSMFMLPGGKLEDGETGAQAAVRELAEEVGLRLRDVEPLGHYVSDAANEPGHLVDAEVFTADLPVAPDDVRVAAEIAELHWLDPAVLDAVPVAPLLLDVLPDLTTVTVVGIGADGWAGLTDAARERITTAPYVVGAARQLGLLPDVPGQERAAWPSPFDVAPVEARPGRPVLVLASGDPMVSGIGTRLAAHPRRRVDVVPAVSSVALARARMGWGAEDVEVISSVGRPLERVRRQVAPDRRLLVLSSDERTPSLLARLLTDLGHGDSVLTVLGDLGGPDESRVSGLARTWDAEVPRLNVVAVACVGPASGSWAAGLPDDAYEHDGQLTRRDLRASALARLRPQPGQLLWDVGAGAGSVGIEWMRAHPTCRTVAFERDETRAARVLDNARRLGVPDLRVVHGEAHERMAGEGDPHAVFVGGGATVPGLLGLCRDRLRPGGRLVVHGVTLETERLLVDAHAEHGGELTRHHVETAAPLGGFTGWTPARGVVQWAWEKPETP